MTPALVLGFVAIIFLLVATLVVGDWNLRDVYAAGEAVEHSEAVKVTLQQVLMTAVDAETGQRGFIITGEDSYLEPYDRARSSIADDLARVQALVRDDKDQQLDLSRVSAAVHAKMAELAEAIQRRRTAGFEAAQAVVSTNVGKQTMDTMRSIVGRMNAREDARLAARLAQAEDSYRYARLTRLVSTGVALVAIIALFVATLRYGAERIRALRLGQTQQAQLREALQHKDDFVAIVSHELRNPTNTIVGWARMLEQRTIPPDRLDKAIGAIVRNGESLRQLVDDLMDTSQLVAGRTRLAVGSVDLSDVVRDAIDAVRLSADNKGVALIADVDANLNIVTGDAARLKQVVWNLLANAIKFTPAGGRVDIAVTAVDRGVRIEVRDTGQGIEPEFLPHVFERFRQAAHPTGAQGGLGLGLAIVRHLVELHGGTVTVHSAGLLQGSTFVVSLPANLTSGTLGEHASPISA